MNWAHVLGLAVQYGPLIKTAIDEATSNDDLVTKIRTIAAPLVPALESAARQSFPQVAPAIQLAAAAMTTFDPSVTKWVQRSLNLLIGAGLDVDGIYGPATKAAIVKFQEQTLGLKADGWAGQLTQAAIGAALAKLY